MIKVTVAPELQNLQPQLTLGVISFRGLVGPTPDELIDKMNSQAAALRDQYTRETMLSIPGIKECRDAFRALHIDPTRYRPSSEALIRRILQGDNLPSVNAAVDLGNYWSVRHSSPLGLLNLAAIEGDVVCRLGSEVDHYEGLNGRVMNMEGKPLLADDIGPFGSPIVDSQRTQVCCRTTEMLLAIFLFAKDNDTVRSILGEIAASFAEHGFEAMTIDQHPQRG